MDRQNSERVSREIRTDIWQTRDLPLYCSTAIAGLKYEKYLTPGEVLTLSTQSAGKRGDWLLGRYAVKNELVRYIEGTYGRALHLKEVEIISVPFGPPLFRIHVRSSWDSNRVRYLESNLCISIAHSNGYATAAVAHKQDGVVGVDIEPIRTFKKETLAAFLTDTEYERFLKEPPLGRDIFATRMWCLKEAYLKAKGVGLLLHPRRIELQQEGASIEVFEDGQATHAHARWTLKNERCMLTDIRLCS